MWQLYCSLPITLNYASSTKLKYFFLFWSEWTWQHYKVCLVNKVKKKSTWLIKHQISSRQCCGSVRQFYGLLLPIFKILDVALDKANSMQVGTRLLFLRSCQLDRRLELYVYLQSSSVQKAGIDQWQPAKPCRQRSLPRWNQLRSWRGGGIWCGVRDMWVCVCDVSEEGGLFVLGSWHRSCWRF